MLFEPYLYDVIARGRYDRDGVRRGGTPANGFGSLTYAVYGVTDSLAVGLIPTVGFNTVSGGPSSSGIGLGDAAWEYSLTRRWVLALDATYRHARNTRATSVDVWNQSSLIFDSGASDALGLAPAIAYSWTPNLGVLLGVRVIPAGRNTSSTVTPVLAINVFH